MKHTSVMKNIAALLFCATLTLSANAQQNDGKQPRPQMGIIDMQTINNLGLSEKQVAAVKELNDKQQEEMKALFKGQKDQKKEDKEARQAERKAQMEKMQAKRAEVRKQLRKTLGDDKYIEYLEKQVDKRQQGMGPRGGQRGQGGPRQRQNN